MINFIRYYLKLIKKFILPFEAEPIVKLSKKDKNCTDLFLKFQSKRGRRIFYIIKRTPGAGLFSNLIFVLNHLKIAKDFGYIPIVDMENFPTIYNELTKINETKNSWNYYFENKQNYELKDIYKNRNFILSSNKFSKSFSHQINNDQLRKCFNDHFKIKQRYLNYVNIFSKKNFKRKTLAVHLRGTSYKTSANHPSPVTNDQAINLIDKIVSENKYSKIFLCTEDLNYLNLMKKRYKSKLIFLRNVYRSYNDDAFKKYPQKLHRYKLGKDICKVMNCGFAPQKLVKKKSKKIDFSDK